MIKISHAKIGEASSLKELGVGVFYQPFLQLWLETHDMLCHKPSPITYFEATPTLQIL